MSMMTIHFSWLGPELLVCCLAHRGLTGVLSFRFALDFNKLFGAQGSPSPGSFIASASPRFLLAHLSRRLTR